MGKYLFPFASERGGGELIGGNWGVEHLVKCDTDEEERGAINKVTNS